MPTIKIHNLDELRAAVGDSLGPSDWVLVDQAKIDAFAAVTGDQQWIHVDPERARRSPWGHTIAHGYLTLALAPMLMDQLLDLRRHCTSINYGLNRLRYLAPVACGSRVRLAAQVKAVEPRPDGSCLATYQITFELEGETRPALVAETLSLYLAPVPA